MRPARHGQIDWNGVDAATRGFLTRPDIVDPPVAHEHRFGSGLCRISRPDNAIDKERLLGHRGGENAPRENRAPERDCTFFL